MEEQTCNCGKEGLFSRSGVGMGTSVVVFGFQGYFGTLTIYSQHHLVGV